MALPPNGAKDVAPRARQRQGRQARDGVEPDCDTRPRRKGGSGYAVLMIRPVAIRLPSSWSPAGAQEHANACDDDDPRCARGDAPS